MLVKFYILALLMVSVKAIELSPNIEKPTPANDAPWMVSLQVAENDFAYCGATLVKTEQNPVNDSCSGWIVTSASCLKGAGDENMTDVMRVTIGNINLKEKDENEKACKVLSALTHEHYDKDTYEFDIGIIKVTFPEPCGIPVLTHIRPDLNETHYPAINATTYGWGLTVENGPLQKTLQNANMTLKTQRECAAAYGSEIFKPTTMICAGGVSEGGPCSHDTGGPLTCKYKPEDVTNTSTYLCGVASFGRGCKTSSSAREVYSVFTDVSNVNITKWIDEHTV